MPPNILTIGPGTDIGKKRLCIQTLLQLPQKVTFSGSRLPQQEQGAGGAVLADGFEMGCDLGEGFLVNGGDSEAGIEAIEPEIARFKGSGVKGVQLPP